MIKFKLSAEMHIKLYTNEVHIFLTIDAFSALNVINESNKAENFTFSFISKWPLQIKLAYLLP